jgi:transcriptional regulator with XRE-family HTH domain
MKKSIKHSMRMIEHARENKKLTQKQLSEHLGVTFQQYSSIKVGKVNLPEKHISKICKTLDLPVESLLYELAKDYLDELREKHLETTPNN